MVLKLLCCKYLFHDLLFIFYKLYVHLNMLFTTNEGLTMTLLILKRLKNKTKQKNRIHYFHELNLCAMICNFSTCETRGGTVQKPQDLEVLKVGNKTSY